MQKYSNAGKTYSVDEVVFEGAIINVNGTSITDCALLNKLMKMPHEMKGYTVFCDSDEIYFERFESAYAFAKKMQKNTASI